jgi:hypothetical protein
LTGGSSPADDGRVSGRERALVLALIASLLLWNLPFGGFVLYPFKLLSTWLHELCHGVVMLATGAGFSHLEIYRDTSGIAISRSETGAIVASAGYLGASVSGALLLALGQGRRAARAILASVAALLAVTGILWVANDFGRVVVAVGAAAFALIAIGGGDRLTRFVVSFVAAQACIQAVLDIRVLFRSELVIDGRAVGASDAHVMARNTFGTSQLWATVWLLASFAAFYVALRAARRRDPLSAPAPAPPPPTPG